MDLSYKRIQKYADKKEEIKTELEKIFNKPIKFEKKEIWKLIDRIGITRKKTDAILIDMLLFGLIQNGFGEQHIRYLDQYLNIKEMKSKHLIQRIRDISDTTK